MTLFLIWANYYKLTAEGLEDYNLPEWRGAPQSHPCAVGIIIEGIQGGVPYEMVHILAFFPLASLKSSRV